MSTRDTEKKLKSEFADLYVKSGIFKFDANHEKSDERLPSEAKFRLNFSNLLANYSGELAYLFIKAISTHIYRRYAIDTILGVGDSGAILTASANAQIELLKDMQEESVDVEKFLPSLKEYRWAYLNKEGDIRGVLKDKDKVAVIDEGSLYYGSIFKGIKKVRGQYKELNFPLIVTGVDMCIFDEDYGVCKKERFIKEMKELEYETDVIIINTLEDIVIRNEMMDNGSKIGEENVSYLEEFVIAQCEKEDAYKQKIKAKKVA